ncbi:hypothetical protein ILUMI_02026 [Ignelater luminosus]|uniref:Uncharacterized protein n=1 Tax=Ignelater luminosus TaxID=2038154 RepID=A0A8K0GJN2_IGNLU|nr:hypothetical protein ILUMI_02026 [Ignelater luminosus]
MTLTFLFLLIVGSIKCKPEISNTFLKLALREILTTEVVGTCNDVSQIFNIEPNRSGEGWIRAENLKDLVNNNSDSFLEENSFQLKSFVFDNETELLLSTMFEKIYEKLANLKDTKLNETVYNLRKINSSARGYHLLNIFNVVYGPNNNSQRVAVENILKIKLLNLSKLNLQNRSSFYNRNESFDDYGYFEYLSEQELRNYARSITCTFLILANFSGNYHYVKELLQPLEVINEDENSSLAMLIFVNKFFNSIMEREGNPRSLFRILCMNYVVDQLYTVNPFNRSELFAIEDEDNKEIKRHFEKLKKTHPEGILTLLLEWRLLLHDLLEKSDISEYLLLLDKTFRVVEQRRRFRILNNVVYRRSNDAAVRQALIERIKEKLKNVKRNGTRVEKALAHIKSAIDESETPTPLLQFAEDYLDQLTDSKMNILPSVYKYITRQLNTIEPINASRVNEFREQKIEQVTVLLNEFRQKDPRSIDTMALDWLFDLKLQILMRNRTATIFDILRNTYREVQRKRDERMKQVPRSVLNLEKSSIKEFLKVNQLSEEDQLKLHYALGM